MSVHTPGDTIAGVTTDSDSKRQLTCHLHALCVDEIGAVNHEHSLTLLKIRVWHPSALL